MGQSARAYSPVGYKDPEAPVRPLPPALKVWSRIGGRFGIKARLRTSQRLSSRLLTAGAIYEGSDGFAFSIDPGDPFQATMLLGLHDPVVQDILALHTPSGGTAIDAGANLGFFTLRFARLVGPSGAVHAFECDPRIAPRLRRHVALNGFDWVSVNEAGLLDQNVDDVQLYLPAQLGWASTTEGAWGATEATTVKMVTLDRYIAEQGLDPGQLSFVKLDVEGAELRALRGAREVLTNGSPAVLIEYDQPRMRALGEDPSELVTLMDEFGFSPWSPVGRRRGHVQLAAGVEPTIGEDVLFLKR